MKQPAWLCKFILFGGSLMILFSTSCGTIFPVSPTLTATPTPTAVPTSTPKPLKLINGEIRACLLVSSAEIETVSGVSIIRESWSGEGDNFCKYISVTDNQVILVTDVYTDVSLKKANEPYSAVEWFELRKQGNWKMQEKVPLLKNREIDNLGAQAYFHEGAFLEIHILKNKIYYSLSTSSVENGGIGYEALMKLAKLALLRMP
jgi:hypothetical protein